MKLDEIETHLKSLASGYWDSLGHVGPEKDCDFKLIENVISVVRAAKDNQFTTSEFGKKERILEQALEELEKE